MRIYYFQLSIDVASAGYLSYHCDKITQITSLPLSHKTNESVSILMHIGMSQNKTLRSTWALFFSHLYQNFRDKLQMIRLTATFILSVQSYDMVHMASKVCMPSNNKFWGNIWIDVWKITQHVNGNGWTEKQVMCHVSLFVTCLYPPSRVTMDCNVPIWLMLDTSWVLYVSAICVKVKGKNNM